MVLHAIYQENRLAFHFRKVLGHWELKLGSPYVTSFVEITEVDNSWQCRCVLMQFKSSQKDPCIWDTTQS